MNFGRWRQATAALVFCGIANAGSVSYTFGADGGGAPISLNQMDPASAASVTNVKTPVGDGNTGFNGGLVGVGTLLYGIGNDLLGNATLYSFTNTGLGLTAVSSDFNVIGDAAGVGFFNGLGEHAGVFYAIGDNGAGEDLLPDRQWCRDRFADPQQLRRNVQGACLGQRDQRPLRDRRECLCP